MKMTEIEVARLNARRWNVGLPPLDREEMERVFSEYVEVIDAQRGQLGGATVAASNVIFDWAGWLDGDTWPRDPNEVIAILCALLGHVARVTETLPADCICPATIERRRSRMAMALIGDRSLPTEEFIRHYWRHDGEALRAVARLVFAAYPLETP